MTHLELPAIVVALTELARRHAPSMRGWRVVALAAILSACLAGLVDEPWRDGVTRALTPFVLAVGGTAYAGRLAEKSSAVVERDTLRP